MQGDKIEVSYQVRSNFSDKDGQARYFTNLNAYKIVKLAETQQSGQQQAATPPPQQADQAEQESQDSAAQTPHDGSPDLPF
jgi:single-stranded DNA-binding protein